MMVIRFLVRLGKGFKNMERYYLSRLESKLAETVINLERWK